MVLATKGTVRLARGLTSSTKMRGFVRVRLLDGELHVHQAADLQRAGHGLGLALQLGDGLGLQREGRQRAGAVAGVHAGLLDVLHDAGDEHASSPSQRASTSTSVARRQVLVDQHRAVAGDLHGVADVAVELLVVADDLHGPAAQHVGGADHHRVADLVGAGEGLVAASGRWR